MSVSLKSLLKVSDKDTEQMSFMQIYIVYCKPALGNRIIESGTQGKKGTLLSMMLIMIAFFVKLKI